MKLNIIIQTNTMRLILSLAWILLSCIQLSGQEQTDSTDYQDFSRLPFQTLELEQIAKTQVAGEYWYFEASNCAKQNEQLFLKVATADARTIEWMEKFKLQERKTEEVKPSFLQQPYVIAGMIVLAGAAGIYIGAQF